MEDSEGFPFFSEAEAAVNSQMSEDYRLNYELERAWFEAIDKEMRTAGFVPIDNEDLSRLAVPSKDWGGTCYTRNGLVACMSGGGWSVYAQGTELCLGDLPDDIDTVVRFVRKVETIRVWPRVHDVGHALRDQLDNYVKQAVREEIRVKDSALRRLRAWIDAASRKEASVPTRPRKLKSRAQQAGAPSAGATTERTAREM